MAERYLAGWPVVPCGLCQRPTDLVGQKTCARCWNLQQVVRTHAKTLLADPVTAPAVRALFDEVLKPAAPEPPKVA